MISDSSQYSKNFIHNLSIQLFNVSGAGAFPVPIPRREHLTV